MKLPSVYKNLLCASTLFLTLATMNDALAGPLATGSGWVRDVEGAKRTFSFAAVELPDGSISGMAEVHNRTINKRQKLAITEAIYKDEGDSPYWLFCGHFTHSTIREEIGTFGFFAVQDNAGTGEPDRITYVGFTTSTTYGGFVPWNTPLDIYGGLTVLEAIFYYTGWDLTEVVINCENLDFIATEIFGARVVDLVGGFVEIGRGNVVTR